MSPVPSLNGVLVEPRRWEAEHIAVLYPAFWSALRPAIVSFEAEHPDVDVGPGTLDRSNAYQRELRQKYERDAALFAKGIITRPPLPAARPGASAHNYDLCTRDDRHDVRGADGACPRCRAPLKPASLAADVKLYVKGVVVPTRGGLPLEARPPIWQEWAKHLRSYPALRDGGVFSQPDTPHVEDSKWDVRVGTRRL
jgi:hypothetical protein